MIYQVKIGDRQYTVEIKDLSERPIVALVDGERLEIWPEGEASPQTAAKPAPAAAASGPAEDLAVKEFLAPMPGTIISVAVKAGQEVAYGQELCILEAMKMKNSLRAPRSGVISRVHVSVGEPVKFRDLLFEFQA
jgi:biotin carboxyl carrier protein